MKNNIWAKTNKDKTKFQTLEKHTLWVLKESMNLIDDNSLNKLSQLTGWDKNKIKDLIFFLLYFHDIGKATKEFQSTILENKQSYHSLYSVFLLLGIKDNKDNFFIKNFYYKDFDLLSAIILTHHSMFPKNYYENSFNFNFLEYYKDFFKKLDYKKIYKFLFKKDCIYDLNLNEITLLNKNTFKIYLKTLENKLKLLNKNENLNDKQKDDLRLIYSYLLGILNQSDWLASARFSNTYHSINFKEKPSKCDFIKKLPFSTLKPFQEKLSNTKGNVLVEISTGEGKTEGSLLWAINNIENKNSKIFYLLPTQVTSNKLYERIQNLFNKEKCGLIHSAAKNYLEKIYEKENGVIDNNFYSDFLLNKTFNKPITIATIDSLFKAFLNIDRYNITIKNFINSVIIIDELHVYDLKLMGFLKRFLEICKELNIKVCLMSASVPNKIKEILSLKDYKIITDKQLFNKKANEIIKINDYLDNNISLIINEFKKGKNVLIIRNTIKLTKETYEKLQKFGIRKEQMILFNSEFKKMDKIKKENLIFKKLNSSENFILIATQIVEISLDIDFDIEFTDNAPIDALIQRFGRTNRKKEEKRKGKIYIFKERKHFPYNETILNLTFKTIKNGYFEINEYNKWLNIIYENLFKNDIKTKKDIQILFDEGYKIYNNTLKNTNILEKSKENYELRNIEINKIDFLLYKDYINNNISNDYTISLPIYFEKYKYNINDENIKYPILNEDIKYSFEKGLKIEKKYFNFY